MLKHRMLTGYSIVYVNTWGSSSPPPDDLAHLYTTCIIIDYLFISRYLRNLQIFSKLSQFLFSAVASNVS